METIEISEAVRISGKTLSRLTSLVVQETRNISIPIPGALPVPVPNAAAAKKGSSPKPPKPQQVSKKYAFKNVTFVAISGGGEGGLRLKIGNTKMEPLTQPVILTNSAVTPFEKGVTVIIENESPIPRNVLLLVGIKEPKAQVAKILPGANRSRKKSTVAKKK